MLQSLYHSVCCFYKFCHWKGQFLAWLPLQTFKNPLIGSSLLENPRGKQASGFSFLEVGFHLESRKASYSRVFLSFRKVIFCDITHTSFSDLYSSINTDQRPDTETLVRVNS